MPVPLDAFSSAPTLKLRLAWTSQPPQPTVERPRPLQPRDTNQPAAAATKRSGRATVKKEESSSSANSREWPCRSVTGTLTRGQGVCVIRSGGMVSAPILADANTRLIWNPLDVLAQPWSRPVKCSLCL